MRRALFIPSILLLLPHASRCATAQSTRPSPPDLSVTLGESNDARGLRVPSAGDGVNVPEAVGGRSARRIPGPHASYLYVVIDDPAYARGPRDLYVTVEFFDDTIGWLSLQYDKTADAPNAATKYTPSEQTLLLTKSGRWRAGTFSLPAARLGRGQNQGADFRLSGAGVAVGRVAVSADKPAGFDPDAAPDAEALRALQVERPAGMELTVGNDATPAQAAVFKALGFTSVESYVDWAGVEPEEGKWDWSKWDRQVATLKAANLKWVPFLLAGPAYATPLWFQRGPHSRYYRCLEHGEESRVQSLFNPELRPYVRRFLKAFADRYRDSGVIESALLGVTGIYGESLYPAGPQGGWTTRLNGEYHNHRGWWAGDAEAAANFRAAMREAYKDVAALDAAWGTRYASFDEVAPFLPDKAPSDRARADFVEWYQRAMTDWAAFWAASAREAMPDAEIYLCTGGEGDPALGADFTAQAATVAKYKAGVRITNEGSDYLHNFTLTREVATATRRYGTFCGFEPASDVSPAGIVARVYNASASGARQLHFYTPNVLGTGAQVGSFRDSARWAAPRRPMVDVALYLPRESWALEPAAMNRCYAFSRVLRPVVDHDYLTRRSVADGALSDYRALVLTEAPVLEPAAAAEIERWVRGGGVLIVMAKDAEPIGRRLYDQSAWRDRLLPREPRRPGEAAEGPRISAVGKGYAVSLAPSDRSQSLLADLLRDAPARLPGVKPLAPPAPAAGDRLVTQTADGPLWLDVKGAKIESPGKSP